MDIFTPASAFELSPWAAFWRMRWHWLIRQRRRFLPYLVWYGREVNVRVTLKENRLPANCAPSDALTLLQSGAFREIEGKLHDLGIGFDTGMGCDGRDWEWDWSLHGPISVRFHSVTKSKDIRRRQ